MAISPSKLTKNSIDGVLKLLPVFQREGYIFFKYHFTEESTSMGLADGRECLMKQPTPTAAGQ